jgi:hypothetical protein
MGAVMATVTKIVRFYEPVKVDQNDNTSRITGDFWGKLHTTLHGKPAKKREHVYAGTLYVGQARQAKVPAVKYVYVGRVREPADNPDTYQAGGVIAPLLLGGAGDRLSEPTIMRPFGVNNFVAVMSPVTGGTRSSAIAAWLTSMTGLTRTSDRIELVPLIDPLLAAKLRDAVGATKLTVRVPPGESPPSSGGGVLGDAIRAASTPTTEELGLEMTWSFGHATGSVTWRRQVLRAAQWVNRGSWATKAEVNLQLEEGDGIRTEVHNMLEDQVTAQAKFTVTAGQAPSERTVLESINEAVEEFRRRG